MTEIPSWVTPKAAANIDDIAVPVIWANLKESNFNLCKRNRCRGTEIATCTRKRRGTEQQRSEKDREENTEVNREEKSLYCLN